MSYFVDLPIIPLLELFEKMFTNVECRSAKLVESFSIEALGLPRVSPDLGGLSIAAS